MAPPKAFLPTRITSVDFLGIRWNKTFFRSPYLGFYPFAHSSNALGRMNSTPLRGAFHGRHALTKLRMMSLWAPTAIPVMLLFGNMEWYDWYRIAEKNLGYQIPASVKEARAEELRLRSREKPGILLKHKYGGQVLMPGSERNIGATN